MKNDINYQIKYIYSGDKLNRKIIFALLIFVVAVSVVYAAQATQMEVKSPDTLKNWEFFNLTLTAQDGSPVANQVIDIIVIAESGEENHINFTTNDKGEIGFGISGVTPGKYTFNCTFNGTGDYETSNIVQELTIAEQLISFLFFDFS